MDLSYKIVSFREETGQISVKVDQTMTLISIDLPVENGKFLSGADLHQYIKGFLPIGHLERLEMIKSVTNASEIKALVEEVEIPEETEEQKWSRVREHRNLLLIQSDWTQVSDAPLSSEQKSAWAAYRQSLRDLPESFSTAAEVVFPSIPA